jgi:hypothetical protein
VIAPFWSFVTDDGFKSVWQMKWVISITLPQSESIISTTSERSNPLECSVCLDELQVCVRMCMRVGVCG